MPLAPQEGLCCLLPLSSVLFPLSESSWLLVVFKANPWHEGISSRNICKMRPLRNHHDEQ